VGKARSLFLGYLHPGQFVGDAAALIGEVHSCAVRAVLPSIVGEIDTLAFLANLRRNTSLALHVARSLAKGLIHADNQRLELLAADLPTRLINFLYESHATVEENDLFISPAPTHADLSRSLGATRESLTRAIGLLRATGEIEVRDQGWIVKRGPDLRAPHGSA
jgi:CRP-like cAMP-binding protein